MDKDKIKPSPFLRWAGGKKWLLGYLNELLNNKAFNNYHESFLGGGAVFFSYQPKKRSFLCDVNEELIETYLAVKEDPESIIELLLKYKNTEQFYYELRSSKPRKAIRKAARFIFLNQTSYNGLYRVNKLGGYNVPYGFRKNVTIDAEKILVASKALQNAHIASGDFTLHVDLIKRGDLVFLDPPYTVSHNDNGFIEYNRSLFSLDDQHRLKEYINEIKRRGAFYILTNAAHETIKGIFAKEDDRMIIVERNSLIGGKNAKRARIQEYVFSNIPEGV